MKPARLSLAVLTLAAALGLTQVGASCSQAQKGAILDASLSIGQIACAMATSLSGEDEVMQFCNVPEALRPLLQQLLVGKRAGMSGHPMARDAGAEGGR